LPLQVNKYAFEGAAKAPKTVPVVLKIHCSFQLNKDSRPEAERTAAGRYLEPTLLGLMVGDIP
jgi:hypothetical protein